MLLMMMASTRDFMVQRPYDILINDEQRFSEVITLFGNLKNGSACDTRHILQR